MPSDVHRRKKAPQGYNILVIPSGEGAKTKSFNLRRWAAWVLVIGAFFGIIGLTILALVHTPIGYYVQIPNPELERRYGKQLRETHERLESLAQDLSLVQDYNGQLRKALGDSSVSTGYTRSGLTSIMMSTPIESAVVEAPLTQFTEVSTPDTSFAVDYDLEDGGYYGAIVSNSDGFRVSFPLLPPTEGFVTQEFVPAQRHFGIDYAVKRGAPVYAATDGYVVLASWTYDDGNMIILSHGGGYLTVYKHNQSLLRTGQSFVKRGELIALAGDTGKTSGGPHLHFEIWKDGVPLDPREFLLTTHTIQ